MAAVLREAACVHRLAARLMTLLAVGLAVAIALGRLFPGGGPASVGLARRVGRGAGLSPANRVAAAQGAGLKGRGDW